MLKVKILKNSLLQHLFLGIPNITGTIFIVLRVAGELMKYSTIACGSIRNQYLCLVVVVAQCRVTWVFCYGGGLFVDSHWSMLLF